MRHARARGGAAVSLDGNERGLAQPDTAGTQLADHQMSASTSRLERRTLDGRGQSMDTLFAICPTFAVEDG